MTTQFVPTAPARAPRLGGLLAAEAIKLRSQRSLAWIALLTAAASVALAAAMGNQDSGAAGGETAVASLALLAGYSMLPYVSAFLASSSVATEFGSGVSRAIYTAVPSRLPVLAAKALVGVAVGAALALLSLVSAGVVLAVATPVPNKAWLSRPATWVAVAGAVASCSALALIGTAVGTLVRRVQGGVVVLLTLLLLAPPLLGALSASAPIVGGLGRFLPMAAANALVDGAAFGDGEISRVAALAVLAAWAVGAMAIALWSVRRADL